MSELHPTGPELATKNLHILARRTGWPDGAADACERFDNEHPGWSSWWGTGRVDQPAQPGFYALRDSRGWGEGPVYGETIEALEKALYRR